MSSWTCEICNTTLKASSKQRHLKTNKHLKNVALFENEEKKDDGQQVECVICCENSTQFMNCVGCKQKWCQTCDRNVFECPYCRHSIKGRASNLILRKRENFYWYLSGLEISRAVHSDEEFIRLFMM